MDDRLFPFEFWVSGTPLSLQASGRNKVAWVETVRKAAMEWRDTVMPMAFLDDRAVSVTLFYFPAEPMIGDVDNIVKPVLDAMCGIVYPDDQFIERVIIQKFEPQIVKVFESPSLRLSWTCRSPYCMFGLMTISSGGPCCDIVHA
jgi:crossover junction endodeoxyribonuclease RusA